MPDQTVKDKTGADVRCPILGARILSGKGAFSPVSACTGGKSSVTFTAPDQAGETTAEI